MPCGIDGRRICPYGACLAEIAICCQIKQMCDQGCAEIVSNETQAYGKRWQARTSKLPGEPAIMLTRSNN